MQSKEHNIHNSSIKLRLPEQYSFKEYTPLISVAGKLYFSDELTIPNNNTIILKPFMFNLSTVLLALQETQANYIPDTDMIDSIITPVEYLAKLGSTDQSDIYDVVYLIKNSNIFIQRDKVTRDLYWLTKLNLNRSGILLRTSDRTIMDYTTIEYDDYNLRHGVVYPNNIMRISTDSDITRQIGIRDTRCKHVTEHFRWTRDAHYEMIYLTC